MLLYLRGLNVDWRNIKLFILRKKKGKCISLVWLSGKYWVQLYALIPELQLQISVLVPHSNVPSTILQEDVCLASPVFWIQFFMKSPNPTSSCK